MILKLDMEKAYDQVNWKFLMEVLERFGFGENFKKWILQCILTPNFFVMVNGEPKGFFGTNRGLWQGDPISPYLFILMAKVLGRSLKKAKEQGQLAILKPSRESMSYTHHQFVNDTILMGQANEKEANKFKEILSQYEDISMQKINLLKTNLFVLNSSEVKKRKLARIIGCKSSKLPLVYLGMPFFEGRIKANYWETLINKIQTKLAGWKSKILSYVGRLNLIKHTLLSILVYSTLVFKIPASIANKIDSREFLWSGEDGKKKYALVAWKIVCRCKKEGGLGISL